MTITKVNAKVEWRLLLKKVMRHEIGMEATLFEPFDLTEAEKVAYDELAREVESAMSGPTPSAEENAE